MSWRDRIPYIDRADFTAEELEEITHHAAMDGLTNSELRSLVILLGKAKK